MCLYWEIAQHVLKMGCFSSYKNGSQIQGFIELISINTKGGSELIVLIIRCFTFNKKNTLAKHAEIFNNCNRMISQQGLVGTCLELTPGSEVFFLVYV